MLQAASGNFPPVGRRPQGLSSRVSPVDQPVMAVYRASCRGPHVQKIIQNAVQRMKMQQKFMRDGA